MNFQEVIGQEHITGHLQSAIRAGKVSHAYLLQGEAGSGKKTLARIFAAALQCEEQGIEPCGRCQSCRQAMSGNHPDIRTITHEKAAIGVDDIRLQLNQDIMIKPYSRPYKVYLIEDAETMTEQAQNAMLKTIEEPPEYAVILLLTVNAKRLLPTVLSRCTQLSLRPVPKTAIRRLLCENYGIAPHMAELAADFADGVPGRAIGYAASESFVVKKDEVLRVLRRMPEATAEELYRTAKDWAGRKAELPELLAMMNLWFRDVLVVKAAGEKGGILFREEQNELFRQAERLSYRRIEEIGTAIEQLQQRMNANVNLELASELLLLTIKGV